MRPATVVLWATMPTPAQAPQAMAVVLGKPAVAAAKAAASKPALAAA
jgi:hypothetical protein